MTDLWLFGYSLIELNEVSMMVRLLLSAACSLTLGFERVRKRRAAGARTYLLVCVGAALVVMTGQFVRMTYSPNTDATRIGAQVVSGIGFIGAGTIMVTGQHKIKGLTTAAGLWASACIGISVGAGMYLGGITVTIIIFLTMTVLDRVQTNMEHKINRIQLYCIFDNLQSISRFLEFARDNDLAIQDFETLRVQGGEGVGANFTVKPKRNMSHREVIEKISENGGVTFMEEL